MQGTYRIEGIEVANVITDAGRIGILGAVAGKQRGFADVISVGISPVAATTADKELAFQVADAKIKTVIVDSINEAIYFKATLAVPDDYQIYELGVYPGDAKEAAGSRTAHQGSVLLNFNNMLAWESTTSVHSYYSGDNARVSNSAILYNLAASANAVGSYPVSLDLSRLPDSTQFKFAYLLNNITALSLRFKTDSSNYFVQQSWSLTNGYHLEKVSKSSFTKVGSPDWANISRIEVAGTAGVGGGSVMLDALRYDTDIDSSSLLSRAVLASPKRKMAGTTMDIEYMLELDV